MNLLTSNALVVWNLIYFATPHFALCCEPKLHQKQLRSRINKPDSRECQVDLGGEKIQVDRDPTKIIPDTDLRDKLSGPTVTHASLKVAKCGRKLWLVLGVANNLA